VERVGVDSHFFELGGDSILSIRVVARARRAGLEITPRQVFEQPTVARLAAVAVPCGGEAEAEAQPADDGSPAPLTPIQRWFFERGLPARGHWNMTVPLEPGRRLDAGVLERALAAVAERHEALRLRFQRVDGEWRQAPVEKGFPLERIDLSAFPAHDRAERMDEEATRTHAGLDLEHGPVARAALFELGGGAQRLLLVAHHLVVDAVSWGILLEDLEAAYGQLERGEPARLPRAGTPFRRWAERLAEVARAGGFRGELEFWTHPSRAAVRPLPVDHPGGDDTDRFGETVAGALTEEQTRTLFQEALPAYHAHAGDLLMAALARVLAGWTGEERVLVELEGHGREDLFPGLDVSRTVGWFTTLAPVLLDLRGLEGDAEVIKGVKEQLRALPGRGLGHGALRWLADEPSREALAALPRPEVLFNYLGRVEHGGDEGELFRVADGPSGRDQHPDTPRTHLLDVEAEVRAGRLEVRWTYNRGLHRAATVERLSASLLAELGRLIEHCIRPGAGGHTPSDFPLAGIDQATLDILESSLFAVLPDAGPPGEPDAAPGRTDHPGGAA
jgi:non-ribosomal peptide synthase protein (TIGR01720 family)